MMQDPSRIRHAGVDPAREGGDRTVSVPVSYPLIPIPRTGFLHKVPTRELPRQSPAAEALTAKWDHDPVAFAKDLGVHLDSAEQAALRASMAGTAPRGRRQRRVLERVRQKIERGLQRVAAGDEAKA